MAASKPNRRLYLAFTMAVLMMIVYSSSQQPHGHTHSHGAGGDHGHAHHGHGHAHSHGGGDDHHGHGHAHGHDDEAEENPSFKYSRAANEKQQQQQQQQHHGHSHGGGGGGDHHHQKRAAEEMASPKPPSSNTRDRFTVAMHAIGSTTLISVAPFLILFFIPLNDNNVENQALLKVLLAFASGSLLGDAFLHLIPHALDPHDHTGGGASSHSHSHSHSHHQHGHGDGHDHHDHSQQAHVGLWVMSGILTFLLVEKLIVSLNGGEHAHSHSSQQQSEKEKVGAAKKDDDKDKKEKEKEKEQPKKKESEKKKEEHHKEGIKVAGYLNLAADFAHNFTDGLAIGASFLAGHNLGIITTFTILFHEVPHEIGDFAILIQSGCSKKKAIFLQLVTALGALSGTLLSLLFESAMSGFASACILPFTAGGFIYIATVTIIPELKESSGLLQSIKEILALVTGVVMMVIISYME